MRCVTHMSPQTQNELIDIMGRHILLKDISEELRETKFFAILADKITSHNVEHSSICARFVDGEKNIREDFLGFVERQRITGEQTADRIIKFLEDLGVTVGDI